jgi:protoporphyrinogen oxidase
MKKTAIIIGAGPAGLTAAYELLTRSDIHPIVLEKSAAMGGISRTAQYKGNRIDIGGHRFFSKSDRVMNWWLGHMPIETAAGELGVREISYHGQSREVSGAAAGDEDAVMLIRQRKSRIYFLRRFFDYPIRLSAQTLRNLGFVRTMKIGFSYLWTVIFPPRKVENLEEFFISRFGRELYLTFFKSYTEKVWGVPCDKISAEWGAQRIKGLSITKTITHFLKTATRRTATTNAGGDVGQKNTETSLIENFMYPKLGPGQLWELVAEKILAMGGEIVTDVDVNQIHCDGREVVAISGTDPAGIERTFRGDYFFSTMPIQELVRALDVPVPLEVREISEGLQYRDFITVGLLASKLSVKDKKSENLLIKDNWIYIQEPDVTAGRLQIFNNWSPFMVRDPNTVWIGVEYFCYDTDPIWRQPDEEIAALARRELEQIGILRQADVLDSTVIRVPKTYPAYFGVYERFDELRHYLDEFPNLFLVGRNGMHKYNNQDHSMLTAMTAVDNILAGRTDKENIWAVNTEMEYHEEQTRATAESQVPVAASE